MSGQDLETQSLRGYLTELEAAGELRVFSKAVDPEFELAAYLWELADGPAVRFERVVGQSLPVVGNLLNSRARIARGLGCAQDELQAKLVAAIGGPLPPALVAEGPCQEKEIAEPDLASLPIPRFFEAESGPYITAGAIVAKDPESGRGNLSIARLKPLGGKRAFIGIAPNHHLAVFARAAKARGEKLPIAVTLGNHPAVMLAAALYLGRGEDELEVAGALLGAPVQVVPCKTLDLAVPAACEIVLEGTLDPDDVVAEGPVSEFHGHYEHYGEGPVVTFHRMTRRRDAVFQCILPGYAPEHILIGAVAIAAGLAKQLAGAVPCVKEVAVTSGGAGRLHAVIALSAPRPGEAKKAIFAVWGAVNLVKQVTVVDEDIDPWDPEAVERALATRMRPERDLMVVEGVRADRAEPLEREGVIGKLGIDATRKAADRDDWSPARPPEAVLQRVRARLAQEKS